MGSFCWDFQEHSNGATIIKIWYNHDQFSKLLYDSTTCWRSTSSVLSSLICLSTSWGSTSLSAFGMIRAQCRTNFLRSSLVHCFSARNTASPTCGSHIQNDQQFNNFIKKYISIFNFKDWNWFIIDFLWIFGRYHWFHRKTIDKKLWFLIK